MWYTYWKMKYAIRYNCHEHEMKMNLRYSDEDLLTGCQQNLKTFHFSVCTGYFYCFIIIIIFNFNQNCLFNFNSKFKKKCVGTIQINQVVKIK